jgi:hypothetical protein
MSESADETIKIVPKDDGAIALVILIAAGLIVVAVAVYLWKNRSSSTAGSRYDTLASRCGGAQYGNLACRCHFAQLEANHFHPSRRAGAIHRGKGET